MEHVSLQCFVSPKSYREMASGQDTFDAKRLSDTTMLCRKRGSLVCRAFDLDVEESEVDTSISPEKKHRHTSSHLYLIQSNPKTPKFSNIWNLDQSLPDTSNDRHINTHTMQPQRDDIANQDTPLTSKFAKYFSRKGLRVDTGPRYVYLWPTIQA